LLFLIGIVGFLARRFDFPLAPAIIGLILGPLAEQNFRSALAISQGKAIVFLTHPISAGLLVVALLILVGPTLLRLLRRRQPQKGASA
jgi:putative tricarboxylic transport membrane protein